MTRLRPVRVASCPACGSRDVHAIWYGMPPPDVELLWPENVSIGGCLADLDAPNRLCLTCGHAWQTPAVARRALTWAQRS